MLVHNRAEFMPESVTAFQPLIADLFDHKQYRVLADWLLLIGKRLVRTVLIFTESSDQLSRATDRVPGLPASPGYVQ